MIENLYDELYELENSFVLTLNGRFKVKISLKLLSKCLKEKICKTK